MFKKAIERFLLSMLVSGFIYQMIAYVIIILSPEQSAVPLVPDFAKHFATPLIAQLTSYFLVGVIGGAFGAFSIFFEIETWSFLKQGILHFALTTIIWLPIAMFVWGLGKYPSALVSTLISLAVTYGLTWWLNYLKCKKNIEAINDQIQDMKQRNS